MVLITPLMTEKSLAEAGRGWYTFIVNHGSTKPEIARQVETAFKVHVRRIKTITVKGSRQRRGRRGLPVVTSGYKKALVRLKEGEKLEVFAVETPSQAKK